MLEPEVTCSEKSGDRTGSSRGGAKDGGTGAFGTPRPAGIGLSASSLRYRPAPDRNIALRETIVALAHRHRRYGAGMIYLKIRQRGMAVNHKRVERLYSEAALQLHRRKRKKVPVSDRQPLQHPEAANEVWSWTSCLTAVLTDG